MGLGRKGQGAWGPVPGCVVLDATRRSPSDPGRSPQGQQSRSKLSTVQIRCSAIDFSAHIAGWLYPAKHFSVSLGRRTALWHFAGRQGLGGLAFGDVLMASEEKKSLCARGPLWLRVTRTGRHRGAPDTSMQLCPLAPQVPPVREEAALQGKLLFWVICKSTVCRRDARYQLRMSFGVPMAVERGRGCQELAGAWGGARGLVEQLWLGEMSHVPAWLPAKVSH